MRLGFEPVLSARSEGCTGTELACSDDLHSLECFLGAGFALDLQAGERIILIVDGLFGRGPFELDIVVAQ